MEVSSSATPTSPRPDHHLPRSTSNDTFTIRSNATTIMPADRNLPARRSVRLSQQGPRHYDEDASDFASGWQLEFLEAETPIEPPSPASDSESSYVDESCTYTPPTRSTSHSRRRGDNHIPRPPNAFMIFRSEYWSRQKANPQERDHRNVSRNAGELWNNLTEAERDKYRRIAKMKKQMHARMYPDYKYTPVFRKDKAEGSSSDGKRRTKRGKRDEEAEQKEREERERQEREQQEYREYRTQRLAAMKRARELRDDPNADPKDKEYPKGNFASYLKQLQRVPSPGPLPTPDFTSVKEEPDLFVPIADIPSLSLTPDAQSPASEKYSEPYTPPQSIARDEAYPVMEPYYAHEKDLSMYPASPYDAYSPASTSFTPEYMPSPSPQLSDMSFDSSGNVCPSPSFADQLFTGPIEPMGGLMDSGIDFESVYAAPMPGAGLYPSEDLLFSDNGMVQFNNPWDERTRDIPVPPPEAPVDPLTPAPPSDAYFWGTPNDQPFNLY
ncbi:hypothetical protein GGF50DRAFT_102840 [Schizophyllum commune]